MNSKEVWITMRDYLPYCSNGGMKGGASIKAERGYFT